ncbi:MAG: hypothetical protein QXN05_01305 [Acidilobaceae archaeon]
MNLVIVLVEKTSSINKEIALRILESLLSLIKSSGAWVSVIFYGDRAVPVLDPSDNFSKELIELYESAPDLGKSPKIEEALGEALELVIEYSWKARAIRTSIIWSASVKPSRLADSLLEALEKAGPKVSVLALRTSLPGWIKHHQAIMARTKVLRPNANPFRVAESLLFES